MKFPDISEVYSKSIVNWEYLFEQIAMLSVETSHTIEQIEGMEFYKVNSLLFYVNKYLTDKNEGSSDNNDAMEQQQQNMSATMQSMKSKFKIPKI